LSKNCQKVVKKLSKSCQKVVKVVKNCINSKRPEKMKKKIGGSKTRWRLRRTW
jgi:mRNA-degrading endonuclease RelE of RelBE toxin-antitoxin system